VKRILEFSRKDKGEVVNNSINQIIQESVELASHSLPKNMSISLENKAEGSIVQVEKAQMMQVLMNIVINARDAIGDRPGGKIMIVSRQKNLEKLAADRLNLKKAGRYVEINISDNGPGMSGTIVDRVFDPFFSTKEWSDSKGTGIGLSIAYTVVHTYDGSIVVDSKEGQGTTFRIFLPCTDGVAAGAADGVEAEIEVSLTGKTILVVEDEDDVRLSLRDLLSHHGAHILLAENGRQGRTMIDEQKPDVLILDLNMPEMSGKKLLASMKKDAVQIPVIVITGLPRDGYIKTAEFPMVKAVLQKPFDYRTLLQSLVLVFEADG
jgi:CheY-like chemotaxis protein